MDPAGMKAFEARQNARSGVYSFEQESIELSRRQEAQFRANEKAWSYFQARPPWYQRAATWWVISGKREETRHKRLTTLIENSEQARTLPHLTRQLKPGSQT